jgi:hypothetical protein
MRVTSLAALVAVAALSGPALAAQFDFYKLNQPNGGVGDFLPTDGIKCTSFDLCSSDVDAGVFGGDLTFKNSGITVLATGTHKGKTASAVQDSEKNWSATKGAGLGVYHQKGNSGDDNITVDEVLTLTFDQAVTITRLELRSEGHNFNSWTKGATFLLNGVDTLLPQGTGFLTPNLSGTVFTFAYGGQSPDQFYVSAITAVPVPEPGTYAMLLAGLGAVGFVARRRRATAA